MANVPRMSRGILVSPNISFRFPDQVLYTVKNVCVYIQLPDSVQTVYELPLLPNNTAVKPFLRKSGAVRSVNWILTTMAPAWR